MEPDWEAEEYLRLKREESEGKMPMEEADPRPYGILHIDTREDLTDLFEVIEVAKGYEYEDERVNDMLERLYMQLASIVVLRAGLVV